ARAVRASLGAGDRRLQARDRGPRHSAQGSPPRPRGFSERDGRPNRVALLAAWGGRGSALARGRLRVRRPTAAVAGARRLDSRRHSARLTTLNQLYENLAFP